MQSAEARLPDQVSVDIETVQAFRAEERHDMLTIGDWRAVGVRGLQVSLDQRLPGSGLALPHELPTGEIVSVQLPRPLTGVFGGCPGTTQPAGSQ